MSASTISRVHDWDRRKLSLLLSGFWWGVACMAGIVVVDADDAKRRGLHAGVWSLLITFVFLGVK